MQVPPSSSSGLGATGRLPCAAEVTSGDASASGLPALGVVSGKPRGISYRSGAAVTNGALESLKEELGDAAVAQFVARYLSLLDQRITRVGRFVTERRLESGVTILLTLETSSEMVGALELSGRAAALRLALQHQDAGIPALYEALVEAGASARALLAPN